MGLDPCAGTCGSEGAGERAEPSPGSSSVMRALSTCAPAPTVPDITGLVDGAPVA